MDENEKTRTKTAMYFKAEEFHQNVYKISCDWNKYQSNQYEHLKNFIRAALDNTDNTQLIDGIYTIIVEHGKQKNNDSTDSASILCNVIYNVFYNENILDQMNNTNSLHDLLQIHPIFKIKKNLNDNNFETWYIDINQRMYKGWQDYIQNNNLSNCIMFTPKDGIYQANLKELWFDEESIVWMESYNNSNGIINLIDTANFYCNLASIACTFLPLSNPIITSARYFIVASGFWTGGRAIGDLIDRSVHHQSINVTDKQAFQSWFGAIGSSLSLMATGSYNYLSQSVRTGTAVSQTIQNVHNFITFSNLFANSCPISLSILNIIKKYRENGFSMTDIVSDAVQVSANIFFFYNCVINTQVAAEIIRSEQIQIIKDYENSLSYKTHRKEFRRLIRNTEANTSDNIQRNNEIIRTIINIDNKDEFFSLLTKNRSAFFKSETKLSFSDGQIKVDKLRIMKPSEFISTFRNNSNSKNVTPLNRNVPSTNLLTNTSSQSSTFQSGINIIQNNNQLQNLYSCVESIKQYINIRSIRFEKLFRLGLWLVRKYTGKKLSVGQLCKDALNFSWKLIKETIKSQYPDLNIYLSDCDEFVFDTIEKLSKNFEQWVEQWVEAFRVYVSSVSHNSNTFNPDLLEYVNNDIQENENEIFVDPEIISNNRIINEKLIQYAFHSTGSQMNTLNEIPNALAELCKAEFNEYLFRHPVSFDFELSDYINDIAGIIIDIGKLNNKNIIFYKLIALSVDNLNNELHNTILQRNTLMIAMKFMWTLVNIYFSQMKPLVNMFCNSFENIIINIIIKIYQQQKTERQKWLDAFNNYTQYITYF